MKLLKITNKPEADFARIANSLLNEYAIQTKNGIYRMTNIEFYWHSDKHPDKSTYRRIHVNPKAGDWFFHYSGVDIALKGDTENDYGGILIRDICNLNNSKEKYRGPMVCAMKLFSCTNAFEENISTRVIKKDMGKVVVKSDVRVNPGQNMIDCKKDKSMYRFYIEI